MQKDDLVYASPLLDMARKAKEKVAGKERSDFELDENLRMALAHLIQIMEEAAGHVSSPFRQRHPDIPWKLTQSGS